MPQDKVVSKKVLFGNLFRVQIARIPADVYFRVRCAACNRIRKPRHIVEKKQVSPTTAAP